MRGDERDGHFSAGQTHCEIFDATALGKKFRLSWKLEAHLVHPGFVNRAGYDCVELAAPGQSDRFFQAQLRQRAQFPGRLPGREPGYLPMILHSAVRVIRLEFRARSTISGPIPAQSPSVMPMRGLFLVLMLVIVIEPYLIDHEHDYEHEP